MRRAGPDCEPVNFLIGQQLANHKYTLVVSYNLQILLIVLNILGQIRPFCWLWLICGLMHHSVKALQMPNLTTVTDKNLM